jgi:hypothetical protein
MELCFITISKYNLWPFSIINTPMKNAIDNIQQSIIFTYTHIQTSNHDIIRKKGLKLQITHMYGLLC